MRDWFYPYYCGAGGGARAKYNEVAGRWRKRVFRRPLLIRVGLAGLIGVAGILERHDLWPLGLGVVLGAVVGGYIALVESPPAHIEHWRTGFEGERRTARVLAPLRRSGYALLHDLPDNRPSDRDYKGNIDHVVVSPAGVFLLDSKWLGGEASIVGDTVHVQMRDDDEDSYDIRWLATGMRNRARCLRKDIEHQTDIRCVTAVVVFWNKFEAGLVTGDDVVFVHGNRLVGWLQEQRAEMTADCVAHVTACIKQARPPEHRAWWDRLPTLGLRGRDLPVAPVAGGASGDS